MASTNSTAALRGFCPSPFLQETLFPSTGGCTYPIAALLSLRRPIFVDETDLSSCSWSILLASARTAKPFVLSALSRNRLDIPRRLGSHSPLICHPHSFIPRF